MYQILQLNLDNAFLLQDSFNKELKKLNALSIYFNEHTQNLINECRLFSSKNKVLCLLDILVNKIKEFNCDLPLLTFYGSGDFHHITLALLELASRRTNKQFTVIHIDNHPDWVRDPVISCGSWVNIALEKPYIKKIISLGICSNDLSLPEFKRGNLKALQNEKLIVLPFDIKASLVFRKYKDCASFNYSKYKIIWNTINNLNSLQLSNIISNYIDTQDIYITLDKDVININEQITNWDQGKLTLPIILELLQFLTRKNNIIGIDILGDYSSIVYKGSFFSKIYKKFEIFKDQPKIRLNLKEIAKVNEIVNLQLLNNIIKA